MYYILFTFFLATGCFLINRIPFIKNAGLGTKTITLLFLLKVFAGLLVGWMSQKFYPQGNDYWNLNTAGWNEYQLLINDPGYFFKDLFISHYQNGYDGFFHSVGTYWNDLKNTMIGKFLACCNIFSRGNYYINSMIFNFLGFFGHIAFYRVFADVFKKQYWPVIIGCFLLPSTLYFSSGIHKDLVVFSMLGLFSYVLYFSLKNKLTTKYFLFACLSFFVLLFMRNFLAIAMVPATIGFIISSRKKWNSLIVFSSVYFTGLALLIMMQVIKPSYEPLKIITQRQQDFLDLPDASSQLKTIRLQPSLASFATNAPLAIDHGLLRPYIWDTPTRFLIPLAVELLIYELLFILMIILYRRNSFTDNYFVLWGLFVAFTMILFTGYIVPNTGSIVRYRSLYLPLILTPVLCRINWDKLKTILRIKL